MKTNLVVPLFLFILFGCAQPQPVPMTPQEQEIAKKELTGTVNAIIQGLEKMDAEVLFQSYSNIPEFILFTTDGSLADYQLAKSHNAGWFKSLSSLKVATVKEEFRFLPGDVVICAWRATFDMTLKTGIETKMDFAITFVFNKSNNRWKVVYQQTSVLPPAPEKPTN
jgi:ketosteroid isomerase-like protein